MRKEEIKQDHRYLSKPSDAPESVDEELELPPRQLLQLHSSTSHVPKQGHFEISEGSNLEQAAPK